MSASNTNKPLSRDGQRLSDIVLELISNGEKIIDKGKLLKEVNEQLKNSEYKGQPWTSKRLNNALFEIQTQPYNK